MDERPKGRPEGESSPGPPPEIPRLEMPAREAADLRRRLVADFETHHGRRRLHRRRLLAAAAVIVVAIGGGLYFYQRPAVSLVVESSEPSVFEAAALAKHRELRSGLMPELVSDSPTEIRSWLEERGLAARLVGERPESERDRFVARGVDPVAGLGYAAAAVYYRIDERPVTLVAARAADVADSPRWSVLRKHVRRRVDAETGASLLSWNNSGQAYTLVSELPPSGLGACLLCHTDDARRRLVERLDH